MKFRNEAERKKSISYHNEQATIHTEWIILGMRT